MVYSKNKNIYIQTITINSTDSSKFWSAASFTSEGRRYRTDQYNNKMQYLLITYVREMYEMRWLVSSDVRNESRLFSRIARSSFKIGTRQIFES